MASLDTKCLTSLMRPIVTTVGALGTAAARRVTIRTPAVREVTFWAEIETDMETEMETAIKKTTDASNHCANWIY